MIDCPAPILWRNLVVAHREPNRLNKAVANAPVETNKLKTRQSRLSFSIEELRQRPGLRCMRTLAPREIRIAQNDPIKVGCRTIRTQVHLSDTLHMVKLSLRELSQ